MTIIRTRKVCIPIAVIALFLIFQLVPYGRSHSNPPSTQGPSWDSPRTEQLARRACFDCHSNETKWPWYSSIAPISWIVQNHVDEGRSELNFSNFDRPQKEAHEAAEKLHDGKMPLWDYRLMHPESRLSDEDKKALVLGLQATFGGDSSGNHDEHDDD